MIVPTNAETIKNQTSDGYPALDIQITPGLYSDSELMNFNWTYVNYTASELALNLDFDHPNAISALQDKEYIQITIYESSLFRSVDNDYIQSGYQLEPRVLPRITSKLKEAQAKEMGSKASQGATSLGVGSLVINILLMGPIQQLLDSIKSAQILTHLLLVNVAVPATASIFISQLMSLINLQLIDMDTPLDYVQQLDSDVEAFNEQFETMGYESMYMTKNLGIVCLVIVVPIVVWLVVLLMVGTCLPQYKNIEKTVTDGLFCD